jgi:preprotein translocase subunit SecG
LRISRVSSSKHAPPSFSVHLYIRFGEADSFNFLGNFLKQLLGARESGINGSMGGKSSESADSPLPPGVVCSTIHIRVFFGQKGYVLTPILALLLIVLFISGLGLIVLVLMHSGKGTGLSDMIAGSIYNNTTGTGTVQKNLDRWTVIFAAVFFITLLVLMIIYPQGTVATQ